MNPVSEISSFISVRTDNIMYNLELVKALEGVEVHN